MAPGKRAPSPADVDAVPTDHYWIYWAVTAMVLGIVGAVLLHYLKFYDPLGVLPGVERHPR